MEDQPYLLPETSSSFQAICQYNWKHAEIRFSYFNRRIENIIQYNVFVNQYENSELLQDQGVEISGQLVLSKLFKVSMMYNYADANFSENGITQVAIHIPTHRAVIGLDLSLHELWEIRISGQFQSTRNSLFLNPETFASEIVELPEFGILNVNVSHQIHEEWQLFGSCTNALDHEFSEVYGFQAQGLRFDVGFRWNLDVSND